MVVESIRQGTRLLSRPAVCKWLIRDWLVRFVSRNAWILGPIRIVLMALGRKDDADRILMLRHRISNDMGLIPAIRACLPRVVWHAEKFVPPPESEFEINSSAFRAIVLLPPSFNEGGIQRGVLLIKFTETFRVFHRSIDIDRLMRYFVVVLEPSWSGYCLPEILCWSRYGQKVIVQASESKDREFLQCLGSNLIPIDVGASDWVNYRVFFPREIPKKYMAIYVANLSPIKRVHVFLRAIRRIIRLNKDARFAVVLSSWGGAKDEFEQLLDYFDVGGSLDVYSDRNQRELNDLLNSALVAVLLSLKEGSNKTLFEAMFAGVPVIMLEENIGVNKSYINSATGKMVNEPDLPDAIIELANRSEEFRSRAWAIENIAPERSTLKLASVIRRVFEPNEVASGDLLVKVNSPEATYFDQDATAGLPHIRQVLGLFMKQGREAAISDRETVERLYSANPEDRALHPMTGGL